MARYKRIYSETGIYHVMSRGSNKMDIFIDKEDRERYLEILKDKREDNNFSLYAYCIMSNHSHLIIMEDEESLPNIMKRINISYANYFNRKYGRVGHVFQDRYRSEPIEDDGYLLSAVRYVHNNPVKAKIVKKCEDFPWSSYNYYTGKFTNGIVDIEFVLPLFSKEIDKSIKLFKEFSTKPNKDSFIDLNDINEELEIRGYIEVEVYIKEFLKSESLKLEDLKEVKNRKKRDKLILDLRKKSDLSIRDIAALLGIGRNIVANTK